MRNITNPISTGFQDAVLRKHSYSSLQDITSTSPSFLAIRDVQWEMTHQGKGEIEKKEEEKKQKDLESVG